MRNLLDTTSFFLRLEADSLELIQKNLLRTTIIDSPNFLEDFDTHLILPRALDDLIFLSIVVWYIPDRRVQLYLRLELERVSYFKENFVLRLLLSSKAEMKLFLLETSLWSSRSFFGNVICQNTAKRVLSSLRFRRRNKKVKRPKRKRGYDDKGSLRLFSEWKPRTDWTLTQKQNEIEQERGSLQDTADFLRGWLE